MILGQVRPFEDAASGLNQSGRRTWMGALFLLIYLDFLVCREENEALAPGDRISGEVGPTLEDGRVNHQGGKTPRGPGVLTSSWRLGVLVVDLFFLGLFLFDGVLDNPNEVMLLTEMGVFPWSTKKLELKRRVCDEEARSSCCFRGVANDRWRHVNPGVGLVRLRSGFLRPDLLRPGLRSYDLPGPLLRIPGLRSGSLRACSR
jgi:hypothetical protein